MVSETDTNAGRSTGDATPEGVAYWWKAAAGLDAMYEPDLAEGEPIGSPYKKVDWQPHSVEA
jgi:hypothetical protein